jgi:DeoR/GlpR family transcriptional regulator of sugar metabolism
VIPIQRETIIHSLLRQNGVVTVAEVCTTCDCSAETARRDLRRLEEKGEVIRTHGGAALIKSETPSLVRSNGTGLAEARTSLVDRADALIVTSKEAKTIQLLVERGRRAGLPIIAEATGYPGAKTIVAVDNYRAGYELGQWVARHARQVLSEPITVLDVGYPQPNTEARSRGFEDGLREFPASSRTILHVNGGGLREPSKQITADALSVHPEVNVIFGVNDDSTLGALEAYRALRMDESRLILALFGLEGHGSRELLEQNRPYTVAVAMFPELVGRMCVDAAVCAYHHCALPERIITPFAIVTADSLGRCYQRDLKSGEWQLNWAHVEQLPNASPGSALISQCQGRAKPHRIGYVQVFSSHEWYQNVRRAMQDRSRSLGITLEVVDTSQDLAHEVEALKQAIGQTAARYVYEGDTIILDSGRTTAYLARALRDRQGITVITNSLAVVDELRGAAGITLVTCGGLVRRETNALVGPSAEATFHDLRADKAFLAVTGLSLTFGLSNTNIAEATVKQAMLSAAREVICLADYSKIGVESLVKVAPIERVHRLITDSGISAHDRLALVQRGIEVSIVEGS